jgi:hypothetical protein
MGPQPIALNNGTWQFWDIFGMVARTGSQPRWGNSDFQDRIRWKIRTLRGLQEWAYGWRILQSTAKNFSDLFDGKPSEKA